MSAPTVTLPRNDTLASWASLVNWLMTFCKTILANQAQQFLPCNWLDVYCIKTWAAQNSGMTIRESSAGKLTFDA